MGFVSKKGDFSMRRQNVAYFFLLSTLFAGGYAKAEPGRHQHVPACPADPSGHAVRCHTHALADENGKLIQPELGPDATFSRGYSPTQIKHAYRLDQLPLANNGAGKTIALVEAFDAPTIVNDLNTFKRQFGITGCSLTKVNQNGGTTLPAPDSGWALEASLDVEWACAIAPGARLLLVEANNNSFSNLFAAVQYAAAHADIVSMSWGGSDGSFETNLDRFFAGKNVTFFASSGDNGTGVIYPSASPYVVSVGGTTLPLDATGNLSGTETAWSGSGGGISGFEPIPGYQVNFPIPQTGGRRATPDVAFDANPSTGVLVFDSTPINGQSGWYIVGGTSFGAPAWAAITALVDQNRTTDLTSTNLQSSPFYNAAQRAVYSLNYRDIISGTNGTCGAICTATIGYDFVTGVGSPLANALVPYLQTH
jgi:subtilase family serine protease